MQRTPSFSPATLLPALKAGILPILSAIYPAVFHYANNVSIVILPSLERTLFLYSTLALIFYIVFFIFMKRQPIRAANATFLFLIFFNLYGVVYDYLVNQDSIQIEHYSFLPPYLLLAVYSIWLITKLNSNQFWKAAVFLLGILVIFNLAKIIPAEAAKHKITSQENVIYPVIENSSAKSNYPDIYFILFDEFAGFDSMRNYWKYQGVDEFGEFLISKGFFVAENSRSTSIKTLHQVAERLNYQEYQLGTERASNYDAIVNNRVMQYLKSLGYTTVVFDEKKFGYPAIPRMTADYAFESDTDTSINADFGNLFDDFGILVAENTMLRAFPLFYNKSIDPVFETHRDMIFFTASKVSNLDEVPSPKFVHAHLIFPHYPFMFSENGTTIDPTYYYNWNYYLGNYKFAIKLAEKMVNDILENADPARPPIIILQSDHGARNILITSRNGVKLENFPEEYKTHILNAILLPGYDTSQLPQDLKPINTFPIIFNHYFDANIPLVK